MLRATFAKQVSDGQYGHERAEVTQEIDEPNVDPDELLAKLRELVHAELARSPSGAVKDAVMSRIPQTRGPAATVPEDEVDDPESLPF